MKHQVSDTTIRLVQGDITEQYVDVIVNAANSALKGGGGVDGAIHRAGGPAILAECQAWVDENGELPTGAAMVTTAGDLPAEHVVHTVGPVYKDGYHGENTALEHAYLHALERAVEQGADSVAIPSISTGAYGFPIEEAALIALNTFVRFAREHEEAPSDIRLVLFSAEDFAIYAKHFQEVIDTMLG